MENILDEQSRSKLDGIVQQMTANKEPETNIQAVVNDFKQKYGNQKGSIFTSGPIGGLPIIKQINQFGVGLGTKIGEAGLGLGQTASKAVGGLTGLFGGNSAEAKSAQEYYSNTLPSAIDSIKSNILQKPYQAESQSFPGKTGKLAGEAAVYLSPSSKIESAQKGVTDIVNTIPAISKTAQFARGALGVFSRSIPEAIGAGASSLALTGGDTQEAKNTAMLAGGTSAVLGGLGALYRGAKSTGLIKNILSKTTGIPEGAFNEVASSGVNSAATPESSLNEARNAVYNLRSKTTQMWQDRLPIIADKYNGIRTGLSDSQISQLNKIVDEFGISPESLPQNLKNMSALESLSLIKELNALDSLAVKASPKGAIVRNLKPELEDQIISTFGGDKSEIGKLWKEYSIKSQILDNVNNIVNAYNKKPGPTVTAKNRLMAIFDENKPEFLKAVKDLENELGINITKGVASTKFKNVFPEAILKANGGLPTKSTVVDRLINALLLPVTSPKIAGELVSPSASEAGMIGKRAFGNYLPIK